MGFKFTGEIVGEVKNSRSGKNNFYHIHYHTATDSIVNLKEKNLTFTNSLRWQLRGGDSQFGPQIIFNSFQFHEPPKENLSNGTQKKYYFIEQYLPAEQGIYFNILCMRVFLELLKNPLELNYELNELIKKEMEKLENE